MEKVKKLFGGDLSEYGLIGALIIIVLVFQGLTGGTMMTPLNITNLLLQNAYIIIMAIGMLFVIICGYFDMSVGSGVGLIGAIAGTACITKGMNPIATIFLCLLVGVALGAFNGFWIAYMHVPAFVVTLGTQLIYKGLMLVVMGSASIGPFPDIFTSVSLKYIADPFYYSTGFNFLTVIIGIVAAIALLVSSVFSRKRQQRYGFDVGSRVGFLARTLLLGAVIIVFSIVLALNKGIPYVLILLVILIAIYSFIGNNTKLGRWIYAVGGNKKAAQLSGVKVKRVIFISFINMGLLSAVAGIVYTARLNMSTPTAGDGFELDAIAAAFIGGASPSGGIGKIRGAVTGAMIMGILNNGMSLMGIGIDIQKAVKGIVLILAVLLDVISRRETD